MRRYFQVVMSWIVSGRPKRLLVLVNPFGGRKTGRKVFSASVEPLLKAAGITYTVKGAILSRKLAWLSCPITLFMICHKMLGTE